VADGGGAFGVGADHEARGVAEGDDGEVERVAQLQEPGALVGGVGVDRAAEDLRVVRDQADGAAFDADESGDDGLAEALAQFQYRVRVGEGGDEGTDVVGAQAVLGDGVAEEALVRALPRSEIVGAVWKN
jgi:hypothetical protein